VDDGATQSRLCRNIRNRCDICCVGYRRWRRDLWHSGVENFLRDTPSVPYFVFGAVAALAAGLDLRMVIRGGVVGAQRIARHLWRMCLALLIAVISFFLGQSQVFPTAIQDSAILYVPEIAVLGLLIFWMFRVQLSKRYRNGAPNRPAVSGSVGH
jgi:hypothetical protein